MKRNPPIILLSCVVVLFLVIAWACFPVSPGLSVVVLAILVLLGILFA